MKYDLIITGQLFQLVNVQDAHISLPISRTIPIIAIAVVAPANIAINPTMEYQAATVDIASATNNVNNPKNIFLLLHLWMYMRFGFYPFLWFV
jgi:hypothetical protein